MDIDPKQADRMSSPSTETVGERTPKREPSEEFSSNLVKRKKDEWNQEDDAENPGNHHSRPDDLRICLQGVREFMKDFEIVKDLDKLFSAEDLGIVSIIKEPKRSFFFLRFKDLESKNKFFSKGSISLRNRTLKMKTASVSKGSIKKERTMEDIRKFINKRAEEGKNKVANQEFANTAANHTKESILAALKDRICSYGSKTYDEQLSLKKEKLKSYLQEIKTISKERLREDEVQSMEWLKSNSPLCCPLKDFLPCDEENRVFYRTKSEFTIGYSCLDKLPTVGFNVTDRDKTFHSIELPDTPEDVMIVPEETFALAKLAEKYIRKLEWPIFDRAQIAGFWRFMVVKISKRTHEAMINFVGNKTYFEGKDFQKEFGEKFITPFTEEMNTNEILKEIKHTCITFQNSDTTNDSVPYVEDEELELFYGQRKTYHERLSDSMFEVSNSSFLQINIPQSEKMYKYASKCVNLDQKTILLDICSGIGTIGISVGKDCKKVVGIEMVKSSCANALRNAQTNGVADVYEVVEGKVEDKIEEVCSKYSALGFRIVGIIDPPRAGLHPDVIRTLRTCKGLDLLVFICCDIKQSKANIIEMCLPQTKKRRGPPFSPILCTGFDMFPQTPHFESLFVLQRLYE